VYAYTENAISKSIFANYSNSYAKAFSAANQDPKREKMSEKVEVKNLVSGYHGKLLIDPVTISEILFAIGCFFKTEIFCIC